MRRLAALLAVIVAALGVAGCAGDPPDPAPPAAPAAGAPASAPFTAVGDTPGGAVTARAVPGGRAWPVVRVANAGPATRTFRLRARPARPLRAAATVEVQVPARASRAVAVPVAVPAGTPPGAARAVIRVSPVPPRGRGVRVRYAVDVAATIHVRTAP